MNKILGNREDQFYAFLHRILKTTCLKEELLKKVLSPKNIVIFGDAFTSPTISPKHNYEYYEFLGDVVANHIIVTYLSRRFPQLYGPTGKGILSRMKIKYVGKEEFYKFAEALGFWPYVSYVSPVNSNGEIGFVNKPKILEDVFEAFLGALERVVNDTISDGLGYKVCYTLLSNFLDTIDIPLKYEAIMDPITRLKEIADKYDRVIQIRYLDNDDKKNKRKGRTDESKPVTVNVWLYRLNEESGIFVKSALLASSINNDYKRAKTIAAEMAIPVINDMGYYKEIPREYLLFSE